VGATTSPNAMLTVLLKPIVTLQPQPTTAAVGQTAELTFGAYGTPPFWYRWRRDTTYLTEFLTNNSPQLFTALVLTNVQLSQRAIYQLQYGNPAMPQAFSTAVRLNVVADSDGDGIDDDWERAWGLDPADPTDAARDPDQDGFSNLEEYRAGTNPSLEESRLAIASITNVNGHAMLSFATSSNRTYSVQIREGLGSQPNPWVTITNLPARFNDRIEVFTDPLPSGSSRWYRVVAPQQPRASAGPIILAAPAPVSVRAGTPATFEVLAIGTGALRYQWFRQGNLLPGQTGARLALPAAQASDAGLYSVTVGDYLGTTSSSAALLSVIPAP
jgi:hypothetical protein